MKTKQPQTAEGALETAIDRTLASLPTAEVSTDGAIISVNEAWAEVVGSKAGELAGISLSTWAAADSDAWDPGASGSRFPVTIEGQGPLSAVTLAVEANGCTVALMEDSAPAASSSDATLDAFSRSLAVIEFEVDGTIITANENFCAATGYALNEIVGQHHRLFCGDEVAASDGYAGFWRALADGEFQEGEFRRVTKAGEELWLRATYNPILDSDGRPTRIVKVASDITTEKQAAIVTGAKVAALDRSQAVIEFEIDGTIVAANDNFCAATGYSLDEIVGQHHRLFCGDELVASEEYSDFWRALADGKFQEGEFRRVTKAGEELWLRASYNPILDSEGRAARIVKVASDITFEKQSALVTGAKLAALDRSQAVIEFEVDGTIITANENFCAATGYSLDEIVGQHHRLFCGDELVASEEYSDFWRALADGKFQEGEFRRVTKAGEELWLRASYNPILDSEGRAARIVKVASDITFEKQSALVTGAKLAALDRSQAVIEFEIDGTIITANENFCAATGYALDEIVGKHHRMFCSDEFARSPEYGELWQGLARGEYQDGLVERISSSGDTLWLQATYNPILGDDGHAIRAVKFASDTTSQVESERAREAEERERSEALQSAVSRLLGVVFQAGKGDLTAEVPDLGEGPVGELGRSFAAMLQDLRNLVGQVVTSTAAVSEGATEIDSEVTNMARRTERLGATSEEMSANVEELTASIASIARSGRDADELAKAASGDAQTGTHAVQESLDAMDTINGSATEIGEIVKVISEIASQTNLLAFNAAIEAARAGQHGRGFAVVADEVRKLAERSSDATKEISKLITESTTRIARGAKVSENAAGAFRQIAERVEQTYAAINQIATGAEEQSSAASEVNSGIQAVSEETERSAHSCEQIAQTCSTLSTDAMALRELVERFQV